MKLNEIYKNKNGDRQFNINVEPHEKASSGKGSIFKIIQSGAYLRSSKQDNKFVFVRCEGTGLIGTKTLKEAKLYL